MVRGHAGNMGIIKCVNKKCRYYDPDKLDNCGHAFIRIRDCHYSLVRGVKVDKHKNHYLNELMSNECLCGRDKKPGKSFCYSCYKNLPADLQMDLYCRMGDGYEEAYDAAIKWLEDPNT